jgi:hypothetical protein
VTEQRDPAPLRASDADREAAADRLRAAGEDGRLDVDELEDRLSAAYAAKTLSELEPLTADLGHERAATPSPRNAPVADLDQTQTTWARNWRAWLSTSVLLTGIWAVICVASGGLIFFWPIFPIGIWGISMVAGMIGGGDPGDHGPGRDRQLRRDERRGRRLGPPGGS